MIRSDEVSDEMLMALADGELNGAEAEHLRTRVHSNPELAARYAVFTQTRTLLQSAFPGEPVPDRLVASVLQGGGAQEKIAPFPTPALAAPAWSMALAASLVLAIGGFWVGRGAVPAVPVGADIGVMTASLPTGGEIALPDGARARVLASYETDLGLCRMIAQDGLRHVICRDTTAGDWALALSVQGAENGSFIPASDVGAGLIDRLLDDIGAGPALTGEAEMSALSQ